MFSALLGRNPVCCHEQHLCLSPSVHLTSVFTVTDLRRLVDGVVQWHLASIHLLDPHLLSAQNLGRVETEL